MEKKRAKILFLALAFVLLSALVLYAQRQSTQYAFYSANIKANSAGPGTTRKVLAHTDNLMVCELYLQKGAAAPMHSHPEEQISYVVSGKFELTVGDMKVVLGPGDSVYAPGNVPHAALNLEEGIILDIFTPERKDLLR